MQQRPLGNTGLLVDTYSARVPGNRGGESEGIISRWLASRPQRRAEVVVFTKVDGDMGGPDRKGLSARWLTQSVEDSLKRLGVDAIGVHFAHFSDPDTASGTRFQKSLR